MGLFDRLFDPGKGTRQQGIAAAEDAKLRDFRVSGPTGSAAFDPATGQIKLSQDPISAGIARTLQGAGLQTLGSGGGDLDAIRALAGQAFGGIGTVQNAGQFNLNPFTGGPFDPNRRISRILSRAAFSFLPDATRDIAGAEADALNRLRAQAAPFERQAMSDLNERLFGTGQGAVTGSADVELGGGRLAQAFARGLGQADLDRQVQAQGLALQRRSAAQAGLSGFLGESRATQGLSEQLLQGLFGRQLGAGQFFQGVDAQNFGQRFQQQQLQNQALQQMFGIGTGVLEAGQGLRGSNVQQTLALLAGAQGLQTLPQQLFGLGLSAETARSNARLGGSQTLINAASATPNPLLDIAVGLAGGFTSSAGGGGAAAAASDRRLKENLRHLMDDPATGLPIYMWDWNEDAKRLGVHKQPPVGLIAQDVKEKYPDAVHTERGYLHINYRTLIEATGV